MAFRGLVAETVGFTGHDGDRGEAYCAHPAGAGPFPGVVVVHHAPGWDEWTCEVARKFAHHGFAAIAPSLYFRLGDGNDPDVVARVRAEGGMPDAQVAGDIAGAASFLRAQPHGSPKVGIIGYGSGGRHAAMSACRLSNLDALVTCWGDDMVTSAVTERQPAAVLDMIKDLSCPMLGLFGNDDTNPSPDHANRLEEELKHHGKTYEFHRYDGAGHAFNAWYRPNYRVEQALDGWSQILAFLGKHLQE